MTILLNKRRAYSMLHDEKTVLYNYVTNILLDRIISKRVIPRQQPITVIASRNEIFKVYLTSRIKLSRKQRLTRGNILMCKSDIIRIKK